jgi:GMP synthase-like glutamine amidotransferase
MKPVLLVRNDPWESFGLAPSSLAWAGADFRTVNMPAGQTLPPLEDVSAVVMFGGTVNVDMVERHPFLADVREYTRRALDAEVPFLGLCLGSQILARTLGKEVVKSPVKEIGFEAIRPTTDAKEDPLFSLYTDGDMVVQWHEDTYELPEGSVLLASSDAIDVQGYRVGDLTWALQFHQEVDGTEFAWWLDIASTEMDIEAVWGKSPDTLRAESAELMRGHEERGRELFRRFVDVVQERAW